MWVINLFGQIRAVRGDQTVERFRTRKTAALLAFLAHYSARPHLRDDLLGLFWPDCNTEAARNSLSVALSSLRGQLEAPHGPESAVFRAERLTIGVVPTAITTDVAQFEAALKAADRAADGSAEQARGLEDAVDLYRAPFLAGYDEPWAFYEQQRLAELFGRALHRVVDGLTAEGQFDLALSRVERGLAVDPRNELLHCDLLRVLAGMGDVEAALRHYDDLEALTERSNEVVVGEDLRELAERLRALPPRRGRAAATPLPEPEANGGTATLSGGVLALLLADEVEDHSALVATAREHGGELLRSLGQGVACAFRRATAALNCALQLHQAWSVATPGSPPSVRLAVHVAEIGEGACGGEATLLTTADGRAVDWAVRLLLAAHPGQIACSETAAALLRRDLNGGVWLRDVDTYRIADGYAPEHVYQVEYPEMVCRSFPPLNAVAGYANSLPLQLTRFFGREREGGEIEDMLLGGAGQLVTVVGPGGIGKTRLCLETARRLVDSLAGAVWFVPLADITDPERIPHAVRAVLRQPELVGADPLDQVAEALRRQPALLVFDNFEHLVDGGASLVAELLQRVPKLVCLVSSRCSLNLGGERLYRLAPLSTPEPPYEREAVLQCESVRLFVDRAQAVRPGVQVTDANERDLAELCRRLGGLPLALELAANRVHVLSLAQMVGRLGEALDVLSTRQRNVPARHRTLRAAIGWSFDLLSPELRRFACRLSVFRGGWTAGAAEVVCDEPEALAHLTWLHEYSLVETRVDEGMRFHMLDTIRAFGAEELAAGGGGEGLRERHLAYYLALAEEGQRALEAGDEAIWLDRLEAEQENLRAALECALASDPEAGLRLSSALWRFWLVRGHWDEAEQALEATLARAAEAPAALRARALGRAGHVAYRRGRYERARELLAEGLRISRQEGDDSGAGNALNELGKVAWAWSIAATVSNLGVAAWSAGDHQCAQSWFEQGLELRRRLGDRRGVAASLRNLGSVAQAQSQNAAARRYLEESLAMWREVDDHAGVAQCLSELGLVAHAEADFEQAWAWHTESLTIRQQLGDERGIAASEINLGAVAMERGNYDQARRLYAQSHSISQAIGDRHGMVSALNNLGDVAATLGRHAEAKDFYQKGLALQRELGDRRQIAVLLGNLGEVGLATGSVSEARRCFEQALSAAEEAGDRWLAAFARAGLG
ncbi:MAG: tetratricopeptide repeat protein [Armatimonadetes bacterium]|nr:tetratricopeptide repeat protein [Armatimonadota bacterium]